jgi:Tol biopolymer transport system component
MRHFRRLIIFAASIFVLGAGAPAQATFPGVNGRIVYSRDGAGLVSIRPDGTGVRTIATNGIWAVWSADGKRIAYADDFTNLLVTVNADGTNKQNVTEGSHPAWSPDGKRIAFTNQDGAGVYQIYTISSSKPYGDPLRVTRSKAEPGKGVAEVDWSPDGQRILFKEYFKVECCEPGQVATIRPDGTGREVVPTPTNDTIYDVSWGPGGKRIAASTFDSIVTFPYKSTGPVIEVISSGPNVQLGLGSWSPDGKQLTYLKNDFVFRIASNGSGTPVQVTKKRAYARLPGDWGTAAP